MPYINTIDINGEVYHVANLTDGEHVVDLPQLNDNDIFLVRGDIIDSLTSSVSSKPLSAKQGKILNDVISPRVVKDNNASFAFWLGLTLAIFSFIMILILENNKTNF